MNNGYMKSHMLLSVYYDIQQDIKKLKYVDIPTVNHILDDSYAECYLSTSLCKNQA